MVQGANRPAACAKGQRWDVRVSSMEYRVSGMPSFGWRVAGPGGWWRDYSIQSSAIDAVIHSNSGAAPATMQLCRDAVPTLPEAGILC
jgi:hypothetical protein